MSHFHKYFDQIDAHIIIFKHNKSESIYQKLDFLNMKNVQMKYMNSWHCNIGHRLIKI